MKFLAAAITLLASVGVHASDKCEGFEHEDHIQSGLIEITNTHAEK